jgi:hypothetical protein
MLVACARMAGQHTRSVAESRELFSLQISLLPTNRIALVRYKVKGEEIGLPWVQCGNRHSFGTFATIAWQAEYKISHSKML